MGVSSVRPEGDFPRIWECDIDNSCSIILVIMSEPHQRHNSPIMSIVPTPGWVRGACHLNPHCIPWEASALSKRAIALLGDLVQYSEGSDGMWLSIRGWARGAELSVTNGMGCFIFQEVLKLEHALCFLLLLSYI